jgi:hypothetical protein
MSIKKISGDAKKMTLEFDNGDLQKIDEVMQEWSFKDYESLIRFFVSIGKESSDKKTISYKDSTDSLIEVSPADHLVNKQI